MMQTTVTRIERTKCHRDHERTYSGEYLEAGGQRTWYWICPECLETGSDNFDVCFTPNSGPKSYWKLMRRLHPNCWIPAAFR